jgi:hypothetical protein
MEKGQQRMGKTEKTREQKKRGTKGRVKKGVKKWRTSNLH